MEKLDADSQGAPNGVMPRMAALVIRSESTSVDEMSRMLGCNPDYSQAKGTIRQGSTVNKPASFHIWEMRAYGDQTASLQEVIERLLAKTAPLRLALMALSSASCSVHFEIVNWISPSDRHGPGFSLPTEAIVFLADIGADLDVDQYLE